jgi:hypothetical protein
MKDDHQLLATSYELLATRREVAPGLCLVSARVQAESPCLAVNGLFSQLEASSS